VLRELHALALVRALVQPAEHAIDHGARTQLDARKSGQAFGGQQIHEQVRLRTADSRERHDFTILSN